MPFSLLYTCSLFFVTLLPFFFWSLILKYLLLHDCYERAHGVFVVLTVGCYLNLRVKKMLRQSVSEREKERGEGEQKQLEREDNGVLGGPTYFCMTVPPLKYFFPLQN